SPHRPRAADSGTLASRGEASEQAHVTADRLSAVVVAKNFSIGLVQMSCSQDPDENLAKAVARVGEAAKAGAEVVCLPELFRSQYFCQKEDVATFDLAETIPGPSTEALGKAAAAAGVAVIAPVFERRAPGLYHNSAAILDADG